MLTVEEYCKIRIAYRDGMSIREIARRFHHSRQKVRQVLEESEPRPYTVPVDRPAPRLGPFKAVIDAILADDEQAPRKQRHTAAKLYRRLREEEGYVGGYDQVRRYVARHRRDHRETFIPLTHPPGRRLEGDFGHIYVDFPEGRQLVSVLLLTWSYSSFRFAVALPSERTEAILAGMVEGLAFFGCVAWEVWWDYVSGHIIVDDRLRHAAEIPEGVLQAPQEVLRRLVVDRLAVRPARKAQHHAKDMGSSSRAIGPHDRRPGAEVHLRLLARQHLQPPKRQRATPIQSLEEPSHAGVTGGKATLGHQVLIDPLARQALFELGLNDRTERLTATLGPRTPATGRRLRRLGPGDRVRGRF